MQNKQYHVVRGNADVKVALKHDGSYSQNGRDRQPLWWISIVVDVDGDVEIFSTSATTFAFGESLRYSRYCERINRYLMLVEDHNRSTHSLIDEVTNEG